MKILVFFISLSILIISQFLPAAEMYMWIDEKGVRHIEDRPPEKPAKMIGKHTYERNSPAEIQRYEQQQNVKQHQNDMEIERQKNINQMQEDAKKSNLQQREGRREREIEQTKRELEHAKEYQSIYDDRRRNSHTQREVDYNDSLKREQDKKVETKERRLRELENSR
jgi:hypothetical protein